MPPKKGQNQNTGESQEEEIKRLREQNSKLTDQVSTMVSELQALRADLKAALAVQKGPSPQSEQQASQDKAAKEKAQ